MVARALRVDGIVDEIVSRESIKGLAPPEAVEYAARETRRASGLAAGRITPARVERYFSAVLRRRLVRRCGGTQAAAHLVVESVVEDLRTSGRSRTDIVAELERGWANRLPGEVLDEWRSRLCA